eukprot:scaffold5999_cov149-Amphora_coffeaeformis.AAC.4
MEEGDAVMEIGETDDVGVQRQQNVAEEINHENENGREKEDKDPVHTHEPPPLSFRQHARQIFDLSVPIVSGEVFQNTLPVIDLAFVGRLLSKEDLAAAALATVWFNLWNATLLGFCTALDTVLSQAYGAKQYTILAMWTGNGLLIVMLAAAVMAALLAICEPVMRLLGQDKDVSHEAGRFSMRLIPGIFPYYAFKVLVKHLQTQDILAPSVIVGILANGFNIFANWLLIQRLDMGLDGAPWATSLTRAAEFILIVFYFGWNRDTTLKSTWPTFDPLRLFRQEAKPLKRFLQIAASGALSFAAEAWSFEITTLLAGLIGVIALDAHILTLSIATFIYLSFPFAIGVAASIRVGQLVGEGRTADARRSSEASFVLTVVVEVALIIMLWPSSRVLGEIFSSNEEVSDLVAELLPISCIFMLADSIQSTAGGVLRGLGRQHLVLGLNMIGFWLLAVPAGALLTFWADIGVKGLWWGMVVGIFSSAFLSYFLVRFRIDWDAESLKAHKRISLSEEETCVPQSSD